MTALSAGSPWPFGVQWVEADDAFNLSLYSKHATGVTLLCYTEEDAARPVCEFRFRHPNHKTGNVWHCRIPAKQLRGATLYTSGEPCAMCMGAILYSPVPFLSPGYCCVPASTVTTRHGKL